MHISVIIVAILLMAIWGGGVLVGIAINAANKKLHELIKEKNKENEK